MDCKNCGKEIPEDAMFCPYCAAKIEEEKNFVNICKNCGTDLLEDVKFCHMCAHPVSFDINEAPKSNNTMHSNKKIVNSSGVTSYNTTAARDKLERDNTHVSKKYDLYFWVIMGFCAVILILCFTPWIHLSVIDQYRNLLNFFDSSSSISSNISLFQVSKVFDQFNSFLDLDELRYVVAISFMIPILIILTQGFFILQLFINQKKSTISANISLITSCVLTVSFMILIMYLSYYISEETDGWIENAISFTAAPVLILILAVISRFFLHLSNKKPNSYTFSNNIGTQENQGNSDILSASSQEKITGGFAYVLFFIPLIAIPNSKYGKYHANQGLVLMLLSICAYAVSTILTSMLYSVISRNSLLWFITYIIPAACYIAVGGLVIYGMINGFTGKIKELPIIGKLNLINDEIDSQTSLSKERTAAGFSYPIFFIPLIIVPDSAYAKFHANQGLILLLFAVAIKSLLSIFLAIFIALSSSILISFYRGILNIYWLVVIVYVIIGSINGFTGKMQDLPIIGKIKIIK